MVLKNARLILCRPESGLNDFLCEIERCCRYADHHKRLVLVDSASKNAKTFRDSFANYFVSTQQNLILNGEEYSGLLDSMNVYPPALKGRVNNHEVALVRVAGAEEGQRRFLAIDRQSRHPLTFNFAQSHSEQLLVHQQPMGGEISLAGLRRMRLHDRLVDGLIARLKRLGEPFLGIHIRHTDYQTDYSAVIEAIGDTPFKQIFLATDNALVREEFRSRFGIKLVTFSALPSMKGAPLHLGSPSDPKEHYRINSDAVLDLMTLAFASQLVIARTTSGNFSGYSLLAKNLRSNRDLLKRLVGREDIVLNQWLNRR
jgi:hypothetical protein